MAWKRMKSDTIITILSDTELSEPSTKNKIGVK
jgi:hypothetical protein